MKRRGFLGLMGGAAVAGPSMAKQAVASVGLDAMSLPSMGSIGGDKWNANYEPLNPYNSQLPINQDGDSVHDWLVSSLKSITGMSDQERRERIASQYVTHLDADLAVNRSFSLSFKIQEQRRRNFEAWRKGETSRLQKQLAKYLGVGK